MTIDGFLGFLGLLLAVLAILPREKFLIGKLLFERLDFIFAGLMFLIIFYFHFYKFFSSVSLTPGWGISKFGVGPEQAAYLVSILFCIWIYEVFRRPLNRSNLDRFRKLVDEMVVSESWAALFDTFERRIPQLFRLTRASVLQKIKIQLNPHSRDKLSHIPENRILEILAALEDGKDVDVPIRSNKDRFLDILSDLRNWVYSPFAHVISNILPDDQKSQNAANEIFDEILGDKLVVRSLSRLRPILAPPTSEIELLILLI